MRPPRPKTGEPGRFGSYPTKLWDVLWVTWGDEACEPVTTGLQAAVQKITNFCTQAGSGLAIIPPRYAGAFIRVRLIVSGTRLADTRGYLCNVIQ